MLFLIVITLVKVHVDVLDTVLSQPSNCCPHVRDIPGGQLFTFLLNVLKPASCQFKNLSISLFHYSHLLVPCWFSAKRHTQS